MPAVSNSSPLILFSRINRLDLLHTIFDEVIVPPAVWAEIMAERGTRPGATSIAAAPWIRQRPVPAEDVMALAGLVDLGETEAIVLAGALPDARPPLIDDLQGREVARSRGLFVVGSVGIVIIAKDLGFIPLVRPMLDALMNAGLYLSAAVIDKVLSGPSGK